MSESDELSTEANSSRAKTAKDDTTDPTRAGASIDTHRLEAFSDGVMAVIITIMAFELTTPATANLHGLAGRVPALLVYILSFTVVGIYWNNHHHLLRATDHISAAVMWTNLYVLFWLPLVPFATEWVGTAHDRVLPAAAYGIVALGAALAYFALVACDFASECRRPRTSCSGRQRRKGDHFADPLPHRFRVGLC